MWRTAKCAGGSDKNYVVSLAPSRNLCHILIPGARSIMSITTETRSVIDFQAAWAELELPVHVREVLSAAPLVRCLGTVRSCSIGRWAGSRGRRTDVWAIAKTTASMRRSSMFPDCLDGAHQEDYRKLIPHPMFRYDEMYSADGSA